ncbi:hypothetical protein MKQ70_22205 [Chitinophaga sedimenti]|uniref:hypothetical protein n=1 Tax=Chitinophaga sedimenti TaxID=2033606 RepID=UPI0020031D99|nr:hypothetical protein [Chitinophaga sedimenti]MCK7557567.1 hypothetical protein [Chitinophaga sedimenti]
MRGGETAVKTGADGETIMENFLKIVGWNPLVKNAQFVCNNGLRHKHVSKGERTTHNIDGFFSYENPLNHGYLDVVLCSSKHNLDEYSSKSNVFSFLQEMADAIECAPDDFNLSPSFTTNKEIVYKGVIFWISSDPDEAKVSIIDRVSDDLLEDENLVMPKLKARNYDSIFLIDNRKASFVFSAISTAQTLFPGNSIKFLYPHTGRNNDTDEVMVAGEIMPIQYINSSILPIVIDGDTVSILLFCDEPFNRNSLSKIIWFAHKICGLANSITIFFNDYHATRHENEVNFVKQSFKDQSFTKKITVRRIRNFDFVTLRESEVITNEASTRATLKLQKVKSSSIEDNLERILPFGEMMRPIIDSTALSDKDIRSFLTRKGIYLGKTVKAETVPLLSTLLLSPQEVDVLKYMLKVKEDKVKSVPRSARLVKEIESISKISSTIYRNLDGHLPSNCRLLEMPHFEDVGEDALRVQFRIEKTNTTKDLITGQQINDAALYFELRDGDLNVRMDYTSKESYKYVSSVFKNVEKGLIENNLIESEFLSIKFGSFSGNTERINFLLGFLQTDATPFFPFFQNAQLEYIVFKPDNSITNGMPADLYSLKDKVSELRIGGSELDTIHYFNPEYKMSLLMESVKIAYKFNHASHTGNCVVQLEFRNGLTEPSAELQCNLEIRKGRGSRGVNVESVRKGLLERMNRIIKDQFQRSVIKEHIELGDKLSH